MMEVKGKEGRTKMVVPVERVFSHIIKEAGEENKRIIAMMSLQQQKNNFKSVL